MDHKLFNCISSAQTLALLATSASVHSFLLDEKGNATEISVCILDRLDGTGYGHVRPLVSA